MDSENQSEVDEFETDSAPEDARTNAESTGALCELLSQLEEVEASIIKMGGPRQEELLDFVNLIRCRVQPSEKAKSDEHLDVVRGKLRVPNIFGSQTRRRRQPGVNSKET